MYLEVHLVLIAFTCTFSKYRINALEPCAFKSASNVHILIVFKWPFSKCMTQMQLLQRCIYKSFITIREKCSFSIRSYIVQFVECKADLFFSFLKFSVTYCHWYLQVLVCGDIRGNLVLFPLLKSTLVDTSAASDMTISALTYFKGAHGISSVTTVAVSRLNSNQIEIRSVYEFV